MNNEKGKVISTSARKNIKMVVYHNVGPDGSRGSITRHEPLDPLRPHYKRFGVRAR